MSNCTRYPGLDVHAETITAPPPDSFNGSADSHTGGLLRLCRLHVLKSLCKTDDPRRPPHSATSGMPGEDLVQMLLKKKNEQLVG